MIAPIWAPLFHTDLYWYRVVNGSTWGRLRFSVSWRMARSTAGAWDSFWDSSNGCSQVGTFS